MAYSIFEKQYPSKSLSPTITLSPLGRCTLNRAAAELLNKDAADMVLLLWDEGAKRFALRPLSKNDKRAFQLKYFKKKTDANVVVGAAFSGVMFLKNIGYAMKPTGTYAITRSEDGSMYEVQLPPERFNQQPQLSAVEGGKRHGKAS
jgi:hypothetical protein